MDWRDLRIALAVERHHTLAAAGVALAIDPTTVSRRIAALEESLGATLFVRGSEGWVPTEAGRRVVERAARMAEEVRSLGHDVDSAVARVEGTVRITSLEEVFSTLVAPHLPALRERHPGLSVQLLATERVLDLARGRADIALRLGRPSEPDMRIRRLGTVTFGLYASRRFLDRHRIPALPSSEPVPIAILGTLDRPLLETRWALSLLSRAELAASTSSATTLLELVRHGVGVGVLAVATAEAAGLVRLDVDTAPCERPLWRVVPESISDAPRIRAVVSWLDGLPLI